MSFQQECDRRRREKLVLFAPYSIRESLKAAKGFWDKELKAWLMPNVTSMVPFHAVQRPDGYWEVPKGAPPPDSPMPQFKRETDYPKKDPEPEPAPEPQPEVSAWKRESQRRQEDGKIAAGNNGPWDANPWGLAVTVPYTSLKFLDKLGPGDVEKIQRALNGAWKDDKAISGMLQTIVQSAINLIIVTQRSE